MTTSVSVFSFKRNMLKWNRMNSPELEYFHSSGTQSASRCLSLNAWTCGPSRCCESLTKVPVNKVTFPGARCITSQPEPTCQIWGNDRTLSKCPSCMWGFGWWFWWAAWFCVSCCPSPLSWSSGGSDGSRGSSERSRAGGVRWKPCISTGYSSCSDWPGAQTEWRPCSLNLDREKTHINNML